MSEAVSFLFRITKPQKKVYPACNNLYQFVSISRTLWASCFCSLEATMRSLWKWRHWSGRCGWANSHSGIYPNFGIHEEKGAFISRFVNITPPLSIWKTPSSKIPEVERVRFRYSHTDTWHRTTGIGLHLVVMYYCNRKQKKAWPLSSLFGSCRRCTAKDFL